MIQQESLEKSVAEPTSLRLELRLRPGSIGGYVILLLLFLIYAIPLVFVLFVAVETNTQFNTNAAALPSPVLLSNFPDAWVQGTFGSYFGNTLLDTFTVVGGTLVVGTLAAYPIARKHVRGSNGFYLLFLSGLLLPAGIIPQFFVLNALGIYDTRIGYIFLWISRIALPIFILTGFVQGISPELDDAAAIDGCSYLRYVFQVIAPLLQPALAVVGLIVSIHVWNDIIGPVIFLPSNDIKPISAGLFQFYSEFTAQWTLIGAAIVMTASPLVLLFLFTQRYIVAGITSGALKG
ncbi:MAG TPA: carbohydrate ABC transporter permease [Chloroflexota bacterium]|nr:carbohydrate ABC transporter permease [Chloroflexota bacterium]